MKCVFIQKFHFTTFCFLSLRLANNCLYSPSYSPFTVYLSLSACAWSQCLAAMQWK